MKKTKHRTKMKLGKSERGLKIVAVVVSLIFAAAMLYPMIFAVSSAMKITKKYTRYRRNCFRMQQIAYRSC